MTKQNEWTNILEIYLVGLVDMQNGKELVFGALKNQETERVPWVPFVGCHAASLIGVTCVDYFNSKEHIVNGVLEAYNVYRPDGLPVLFDLQIEAEALGCKLKYADENPPSVFTHPLEDGVKLSELQMLTEDMGRFPIVLEATREICKKIGSDIALYGLITGPYTLATHLMGTEIFYEMSDDPDHVHEVMDFCEKVCISVSKMYIDAGTDIIAVVDPMTSQISADAFSEFVTPYATRVFDYIRACGKLSSFFVCGDATKNVENMCLCKPDNISIDENIELAFAKEMGAKYGVSFGGNIKLTVSMLFGSPTDNINDAKNCMEIGGTKGFILAPGCDMPYATPKENVLAVSALVRGEITEFMSSGNALDGVIYDLPDYANEKQVILDVITLDSASCAPCQYMMEAVKAACAPFSDKVKYIEHKVKDKESVVCMIKLGVSNIPTICIDGVIKHVSVIPDVETLKKQVGEAVDRK